MTTKQLGLRIGVSQSRAFDIEKAEANGSITLDSLERAATCIGLPVSLYPGSQESRWRTMVQDQASKAGKSSYGIHPPYHVT